MREHRRLPGLATAAAAALALAAAAASPATAGSEPSVEDLLARHVPVHVYDSRERHPAVPVQAAARWPPRQRPPGLRADPAQPPARVYGHVAREPDGRAWLQYWSFHLENTQDRGIARTGRHRGDWELVALRLDRAGRRPDLAAYAQHSWIETCEWSRVARAGTAPVVHVAHGSHAALFRPGRSDRPWPDPTDENDGAGRRVRPALEVISAGTPAWVSWPGRWGGAEAGLVPGEHSSPRGPGFKLPWNDPAEVLSRARACGSGPPPEWWRWGVALVAGLAAAAALIVARRWRAA